MLVTVVWMESLHKSTKYQHFRNILNYLEIPLFPPMVAPNRGTVPTINTHSAHRDSPHVHLCKPASPVIGPMCSLHDWQAFLSTSWWFCWTSHNSEQSPETPIRTVLTYTITSGLSPRIGLSPHALPNHEPLHAQGPCNNLAVVIRFFPELLSFPQFPPWRTPDVRV